MDVEKIYFLRHPPWKESCRRNWSRGSISGLEKNLYGLLYSGGGGPNGGLLVRRRPGTLFSIFGILVFEPGLGPGFGSGLAWAATDEATCGFAADFGTGFALGLGVGLAWAATGEAL